MTDTTAPAINARAQTATRAVVLTAIVAAIGSAVGTVVVSELALAAGAPHHFKQLHASMYLPLAIIGAVIGTVGWQIMRSRTADAASTARWLVPTVLVVSFVPDLALGLSGHVWSGVAALMCMHLVVAAVIITVCRRLLPLR